MIPTIPGISGGAGGISASSSATSGDISSRTSFNFAGPQRKTDLTTPVLIIGGVIVIFLLFKRFK